MQHRGGHAREGDRVCAGPGGAAQGAGGVLWPAGLVEQHLEQLAVAVRLGGELLEDDAIAVGLSLLMAPLGDRRAGRAVAVSRPTVYRVERARGTSRSVGDAM
jgi:hypothetical protein